VQLLIALTIPSDRRGSLPGWLQFGVDWRVAGFAFAIALLAVAMVGIWPARAGTRFDLAAILRSDAGYAIAGSDPTRSAHLPIVLQLTLSLGLFAGAIMMALTYRQVTRVDRGHDPRNVYDVWVTNDPDSSSLATTEFFRRVRDELAAVPGIEASLSTRFESFHGEKSDRMTYLPGATSPVVSDWRPDPAVVSGDYFAVIGMPILAGRSFNDGDRPGSAPVAIVSRAFALRAWGTADVLGRMLAVGRPAGAKRPATDGQVPTVVTVVGVAGDYREPRIGNDALIWSRPDVYLSDRLARFASATLVVRSKQGLVAVRKAAAAAIDRAGRQLPFTVISQEEEATRDNGSSRSLALMMATFALASLGLALMGLYGVVAFTVEQRTREVGVRIALGAQARDVIRLIMSSGARLIAAGLGLGLVVAVMTGRLMGGFVVGAVTSHVAIAVAAMIVFAAVALVATYLPARRAARLDPAAALRS
jgi:putative ABC transport system permease protein